QAAAPHVQQARVTTEAVSQQNFLSADEHRLPYSTPNRPVGNALRRIAKPLSQEAIDEAVVMPGRLTNGGAPRPAPQKPVAMRTSAAAYAASSTRNTMSTEAEMELRRALEESL